MVHNKTTPTLVQYQLIFGDGVVSFLSPIAPERAMHWQKGSDSNSPMQYCSAIVGAKNMLFDYCVWGRSWGGDVEDAGLLVRPLMSPINSSADQVPQLVKRILSPPLHFGTLPRGSSFSLEISILKMILICGEVDVMFIPQTVPLPWMMLHRWDAMDTSFCRHGRSITVGAEDMLKCSCMGNPSQWGDEQVCACCWWCVLLLCCLQILPQIKYRSCPSASGVRRVTSWVTGLRWSEMERRNWTNTVFICIYILILSKL